MDTHQKGQNHSLNRFIWPDANLPLQQNDKFLAFVAANNKKSQDSFHHSYWNSSTMASGTMSTYYERFAFVRCVNFNDFDAAQPNSTLRKLHFDWLEGIWALSLRCNELLKSTLTIMSRIIDSWLDFFQLVNEMELVKTSQICWSFNGVKLSQFQFVVGISLPVHFRAIMLVSQWKGWVYMRFHLVSKPNRKNLLQIVWTCYPLPLKHWVIGADKMI